METSLQLKSGEIQGLLGLRNTTLPGIQDQVSELVTQTVNALNKAHNASSSVPAPGTLTGTAVGTDIPTALSGFVRGCGAGGRNGAEDGTAEPATAMERTFPNSTPPTGGQRPRIRDISAVR